MLELFWEIPLRTRCYLERPHLLGHFRSRHVECKRVEMPADERSFGGREVAMPRLVHRTWPGNVEADLHDLVIGTQYSLAHSGNPGMSDQVEEATDVLRMNLDIVAFRTTADSTTRPLERILEQHLDVFAKLAYPVGIERALRADDAVAIKGTHDSGDVEL